MRESLTEMLECPACHGELAWLVTERRAGRIERGEARCRPCAARYPIRDGIGVFLTPDLPRNDLWEAGAGLHRYLGEHPDIERRLMNEPLAHLNPADQFHRALVLEERGAYEDAEVVAKRALRGLYTPEFLACWDSEIRLVIERASASDGPIVDLASGRCYLVERLARAGGVQIVATDFSPRVLLRDRRRLEYLGLYSSVSLLAFDARRTPFKNGAVNTMTTNLGLANIEAPADLAKELRRIVEGTFFAVSSFYPEDDNTNLQPVRARGGSTTFLLHHAAVERFRSSGWHVEIANSRKGLARPTPRGEVVAGAIVDLMPVAETTLEWCVLVVS